MSPVSVNSNYTFGGLPVTANATTCMEDAQNKIDLYRLLFTFGTVLPILAWPLMPSTSEILNYRMLLCSSSFGLIILLLWTVYFRTEDILCHYFQFWVGPLLCCCLFLGLAGRKTEEPGRILQREDFEDTAHLTFGHLFHLMFRAGDYLITTLLGAKSGGGFNIVLFVGSCSVLGFIIWKPFTEQAMTIYYRFTTRQIPALYWLPQNGAQKDFEPDWSDILRHLIICYTFFLLGFVLMAAIDGMVKCGPPS